MLEPSCAGPLHQGVPIAQAAPNTYINTESFSTTWAGMSKGKPYNLWTRYLYNKSRFLFSFMDVYSSAAPSETPLVKENTSWNTWTFQYYSLRDFWKTFWLWWFQLMLLLSKIFHAILWTELPEIIIRLFEKLMFKDTLQTEASNVRLDEI